MSRYVFEGPQHDMFVVGWDNPMQTFFVQYYKDYEGDVDWETGQEFEKFTNLVEFAAMVRNKTGRDIPDEIKKNLAFDYVSRTAPTALQTKINNLFKDILKDS